MSVSCKGVFIIGAKRTPFCKFGGALREMQAGHVFAAAGQDAIQTANVDPGLIDNTVVGNVHYLSQCDGGKTPRYCGLYSGVPIDRPALGVNKACGSGIQAVLTGALDIMTGMARISLTGGTEVMSALPYLVKHCRFGITLGRSYLMEDHIQNQFLDTYSSLTLQKMAENLAKKYQIKREEVDEFALKSHQRWKAAQDANLFKEELTSITANIKKKQIVVEQDDLPRPDITLEQLLEAPTFENERSIVSAANSSVPADGAAAILIAGEQSLKEHQLQPMARVVAWACVGSDPLETGLGAVPAVRKVLDIVGLKPDDVDLYEINETFASQALISAMELNIDCNKVNVNGGAIAMGNPAGATGTRMVVHVVHELRRRKMKRGVAASSCGGGQGVALLLEIC